MYRLNKNGQKYAIHRFNPWNSLISNIWLSESEKKLYSVEKLQNCLSSEFSEFNYIIIFSIHVCLSSPIPITSSIKFSFIAVIISQRPAKKLKPSKFKTTLQCFNTFLVLEVPSEGCLVRQSLAKYTWFQITLQCLIINIALEASSEHWRAELH